MKAVVLVGQSQQLRRQHVSLQEHIQRHQERWNRRRDCRNSFAPVKAFHIDRRYHLERAMQRQEEEIAKLKSQLEQPRCPEGVHIKTLAHLDTAFECAGSRIVVMIAYSKSCGICQGFLEVVEEIVKEYASTPGRAVFVHHDVYDDFDMVSDVARYYGIKRVPSVFFFVDGGSLVESVSMVDVRRQMRRYSMVEEEMEQKKRAIRCILNRLILKNTPSARR